MGIENYLRSSGGGARLLRRFVPGFVRLALASLRAQSVKPGAAVVTSHQSSQRQGPLPDSTPKGNSLTEKNQSYL